MRKTIRRVVKTFDRRAIEIGSECAEWVRAPGRCPRSVEEYRRIVSPEDDAYGMCRNAKHLDQCLRAEVSCHQSAIDVFPMGRPRALLPPEGIPPAPRFVFAARP
jgi:hypothetical protein